MTLSINTARTVHGDNVHQMFVRHVLCRCYVRVRKVRARSFTSSSLYSLSWKIRRSIPSEYSSTEIFRHLDIVPSSLDSSWKSSPWRCFISMMINESTTLKRAPRVVMKRARCMTSSPSTRCITDVHCLSMVIHFDTRTMCQQFSTGLSWTCMFSLYDI